MKKICNKCKEEKWLSEFWKDNRLKSGRCGRCKICEKKISDSKLPSKYFEANTAEGETWLPCKRYENYYEVSNIGRVRRSKKKTVHSDGKIAYYHQIILKQAIHNKGYFMVYLSVGSKKYAELVHRLVAESFLPNPEEKRTVNHKDANKMNSNVNNLEWATYKENSDHAWDFGLYDERSRKTFEKKNKKLCSAHINNK